MVIQLCASTVHAPWLRAPVRLALQRMASALGHADASARALLEQNMGELLRFWVDEVRMCMCVCAYYM